MSFKYLRWANQTKAAGSGFHGHRGRPGRVGGSLPGIGLRAPVARARLHEYSGGADENELFRLLRPFKRTGDAFLNSREQKSWEHKIKSNSELKESMRWWGEAGGFEYYKTGGNTEALKEAMSSAPAFKGIIWRGIDKNLKKIKNGQVLKFKHYSSCTRDPEVTVYFVGENSGTLFLIHAKRGVAVERFTEWREEREVVLREGARIKIKNIFRNKKFAIVEGEEL